MPRAERNVTAELEALAPESGIPLPYLGESAAPLRGVITTAMGGPFDDDGVAGGTLWGIYFELSCIAELIRRGTDLNPDIIANTLNLIADRARAGVTLARRIDDADANSEARGA